MSAERQQVNTPFNRSYWVESGRLLAGFYPGGTSAAETTAKLDQLLDAGIRTFINLTEEEEVGTNVGPLGAFQLEFNLSEEGETGTNVGTLRPYQLELHALAEKRNIDIAYTRIPIRDLEVPSFKTMDLILGVIGFSISNSQPVYVHCLGGIGRTGTVVGCYLKRKHGLSGEEVMRKMEELRAEDVLAQRPSPERSCQVEMLMKYGYRR